MKARILSILLGETFDLESVERNYPSTGEVEAVEKTMNELFRNYRTGHGEKSGARYFRPISISPIQFVPFYRKKACIYTIIFSISRKMKTFSN